MIELEHLVWGGGKDIEGEYWLQNMKKPLQRFYSGATIPYYAVTPGRDAYAIGLRSIIIGQIDNVIYVGRYDLYNAPIYFDDSYGTSTTYSKYIELTTDERDALLDLWPESWLMYAQNIQGYNLVRKIYAYNHDDLVADGIEQS